MHPVHGFPTGHPSKFKVPILDADLLPYDRAHSGNRGSGNFQTLWTIFKVPGIGKCVVGIGRLHARASVGFPQNADLLFGDVAFSFHLLGPFYQASDSHSNRTNFSQLDQFLRREARRARRFREGECIRRWIEAQAGSTTSPLLCLRRQARSQR